ncbi:MAG: alpha/beta hydrolase [Candidatus Eisenbacteria bacterium]
MTIAPSRTETPLFFASAGTPAYAVLHEPHSPRPGAPAVVHCHSLGVEHVTLYRTEVLAARAAAEAGCFTLRYHARGHGDSGGSTADVTFERLVEDALGAADELSRRTGATRFVWAGARFGALVACAAAARRPGAAGLALWEPALRGIDHFRGALRAYLFSLVAEGLKPDANVDQLIERVKRDGWVDVRGYALHRPLLVSAETLDLASLLPIPIPPVMLVQIQARQQLSKGYERLIAEWEQRRATVTTLRIAHEAAFHYMSNPAWESPELSAAHGEWLRGLA